PGKGPNPVGRVAAGWKRRVVGRCRPASMPRHRAHRAARSAPARRRRYARPGRLTHGCFNVSNFYMDIRNL
ncbi:MAG: hypothetical protein OXG35_09185, partial [Acidobacteria bacterium]|nr:hypothetical protein [Acidobacteriota bacterium]